MAQEEQLHHGRCQVGAPATFAMARLSMAAWPQTGSPRAAMCRRGARGDVGLCETVCGQGWPQTSRRDALPACLAKTHVPTRPPAPYLNAPPNDRTALGMAEDGKEKRPAPVIFDGAGQRRTDEPSELSI